MSTVQSAFALITCDVELNYTKLFKCLNNLNRLPTWNIYRPLEESRGLFDLNTNTQRSINVLLSSLCSSFNRTYICVFLFFLCIIYSYKDVSLEENLYSCWWWRSCSSSAQTAPRTSEDWMKHVLSPTGHTHRCKDRPAARRPGKPPRAQLGTNRRSMLQLPSGFYQQPLFYIKNKRFRHAFTAVSHLLFVTDTKTSVKIEWWAKLHGRRWGLRERLEQRGMNEWMNEAGCKGAGNGCSVLITQKDGFADQWHQHRGWFADPTCTCTCTQGFFWRGCDLDLSGLLLFF